QIIASIEKISTRSIDMIQEFLKVEFMESACVDLIKRRENLIEKLKPFVEEYQKSDKKLGKTFHFTCPDHPIYVDIDENKFIQVINNLVSNSLKFTQDGGKIELTVEDKGEHVLISVSDNGIGIPERYHATLFDKFCEARRPGLKGEPSVGLGMSL